MKKNILLITLLTSLYGKNTFAQDCNCKIQFEVINLMRQQSEEGFSTGQMEYVNDSILQIRHGVYNALKKFDFDNYIFNPFNVDTLLIRNGDFYHQFDGVVTPVFSKSLFDKKIITNWIKLLDQENNGVYVIHKKEYRPIKKIKINGQLFYKFHVKLYNYYLNRATTNYDSLYKKVNTISPDSLKLEDDPHYGNNYYFYFLPGIGFYYYYPNSCTAKDFEPSIYFRKFIQTPNCKYYLRNKFKKWR